MKILVPIDFSENANNALEFAKKLAAKNKASITLLYAFYAVYDFAAQAAEIISQIEQDARQAMKKIAESTGREGLQVDYRILQGTVASTVASYASREEYDLIVMGTQGASGIKKALIGSNTGHVIKESKVPVLAIPSNAGIENVKEISVALELANEEEKHFQQIFRLTQGLDLPYHFFHVNQQNSFEKQIEFRGLEVYLKEKYPALHFSFETLRGSNPEHGIEDYLANHPQTILTMISKNKTFFEYLFNKSHTLQMAYHTHVPLLVVK